LPPHWALFNAQFGFLTPNLVAYIIASILQFPIISIISLHLFVIHSHLLTSECSNITQTTPYAFWETQRGEKQSQPLCRWCKGWFWQEKNLRPFLKQLQQSNLVTYSSKLLQHVNKFKKFKVLVLQGMQTLLLAVQQAQNQCTHFFVGLRYISQI